MKKRWLLLAVAVLLSVIVVVAITSNRHPDTSSVASFASYADLEHDVLPSWSSDDRQIIYGHGNSKDSNLFLVESRGGARKSFLIGQAGMPAWSPDGKRVAFSSLRRGKFHLKSALTLSRPFNIWTADDKGGNLRQITDVDGACLKPAWSPDGQQIAFTRQPGAHVMTVPATGGEPRILADGISPAWSPDGQNLAYFNMVRNGSHSSLHIFLQSMANGSRKEIKGFAITAEIYHAIPSLDWSPDGQRLLTSQLVEGRWQPVVINVNEDRIERVISVAGSVANPRWSHDGNRIVYGVTTTGHPLTIEVMSLASGQATQLTSSRAYTTAQLVRYPSAGGLQIPSWLYLPRQSYPARHPALVWLHGTTPGHGGSSPDTFNPDIQYFVDQGFVVLVPNYRGSAGFGETLAKLAPGETPVPDVVAAVKYLKGLDSVDKTRIALLGYSFGGYLTMRTITQEPDLFAAAVDYFGPVDLVRLYRDDPSKRQELSEVLGGTLDEKPEVYRAASPLNFVDRIKIPLLVLCGTRDPFYEQSIALSKALKQSHKDYEYLTYRFAGHGFLGNDSIDANQQVLRFLSTRLSAPDGQ